jgi:hypothetical protein
LPTITELLLCSAEIGVIGVSPSMPSSRRRSARGAPVEVTAPADLVEQRADEGRRGRRVVEDALARR